MTFVDRSFWIAEALPTLVPVLGLPATLEG